MSKKMSAESSGSVFVDAMSAFVRNVTFPLWTVRDHPAYARYRRQFERNQWMSPEGLRGLQLERLNSLLAHAAENCPFYAKRLREANLAGRKLRAIEELASLPVTSKRDIQQSKEQMVAGNIPESARVRNQTGGSTGSPLQFYVDRERLDSRMASTWRHNAWTGFRPGDWVAQLWGARLDLLPSSTMLDTLRNVALYRSVQLNTSSVSDSDWESYVENVRRVRPRFVIAYAKSAVAFAKYLMDRGIEDIRFESVITTAEVLLEEERQLIERGLGGKVFNRYGCRELSVIASECEYHSGLHVNADALLLEIIPGEGHAPGTGKVVITDLLNRSMPLIRYEIGDVARWAEDGLCKCGRGLPRLAEVNGRTTDFLVLPDGRRVSGPALTLVVADMADVAQVQFVQDSPSCVQLKVVPGNGFGEGTKTELRRRLDLYLRGSVTLDVVTVEDIPAERSGKYRFVVSNVSAEVRA